MIDPKYKKGHKVYVDGITSLASGGGPTYIDDIDVRYDPITGIPFHIYLIDEKWWTELDGYGSCYDNPKYMYEVSFDYFSKKPKDVKAVLLVINNNPIPSDGIEMKVDTPYRKGERLLITHDGNELGELKIITNAEGKGIDIELKKLI